MRRRVTSEYIWYVPFIFCVWAVQPSLLTLAVEPETNIIQQSTKGSADRHEFSTDQNRIAGVEKLISQLSEITGEWKILGEDLGVSRSRIERIQLDEHDTELRRRAVLRAWYDSQEQPCWEPVIEVLKGMGRIHLAGEIEKCIAKGCDCELVQCTVTRDADDSSNEAGYSESILSGYYTIIGPVIGSVVLGTFGIFIHIYCWTDKKPEKSSERMSDMSQISPHSTSRTEPTDGFRSRQALQTRPKESYYYNKPPIARYADYLKAYYITAPIAPDIPECCKWPPTPSTQYINLAVVKKEPANRAEADKFTKDTLHGNIDEILNVKKAIRMEDVLKPEGEAEVKRVLVEGAPGVGKSTFAWELCRRWDEIEAMRKYSVVVLLRLREKRVQEAKTVADLFYHNDPDLRKAVAKKITTKEGADTLLVLDGFDEVPASLRKSSLLVEIIQGTCLPKATVLVTSRPSARVDLLKVCRAQVHKHIEVLGFTRELIEQYANSIFASHPPVLADFLKYISTNPAIRSMMYNPLNSAIVVEIYRENRTVGRPIPQTMTQLYNELTLTLLGRYMSEIGEKPVLPEKLEDLPRNLYHQLLSLAKLAFEGIVKQEVIFDRLPDGCSPLGLMNASAELYVRGMSVNYNFLHLTLQEFLSAFYISRLPPSEQKDVFVRYSDKTMTVAEKETYSHMDMVWRFVAGLTGFKDIGWDVIKKRSREYTTKMYSFGLFCATMITYTIGDVLYSIQFYCSSFINTDTFFHIICFSVLLTYTSFISVSRGMYIDLSQRRYRKINTDIIQFVFLVSPSITFLCIIDFYIDYTLGFFTISSIICAMFMSYFFFYISMRLHRYIFCHPRHQRNIKFFFFLVACLMCRSVYIFRFSIYGFAPITMIISSFPSWRQSEFLLSFSSCMVVFQLGLGELSVLLFTVFFLLFSLCILYHFTNILTIICIFLLIHVHIITFLLWRQQSNHVVRFSDLPGICIVWKFVVSVMNWDRIELVPSVWYHQMWLTQFLAQCLYEAQEEAAADCILGRQKVGFGSRHKTNTGYDCFVLGYCIAVSRCSWTLELGNKYSRNSLGSEMLEMLVCGMKSKEEVHGSIEVLILDGQPIEQGGLAHLKEMPHQVLQQISRLDLGSCQLNRAALRLDLLSDIIPIMTCLKHLDISYNEVGPGGTVKLLQALGDLHSLHTLELRCTQIGCDDIMALSQLIRPTGCLKKLRIGQWGKSAGYLELMMKTVLSPSSLEDLSVWDVDFTSYQKCFSPLAENHNLTRLEFLNCMFSSDILAESLYNNTTLRELIVGTTHNFTKETVDALINSCKQTHKYLRLPKQYRWSDWTRCTLL